MLCYSPLCSVISYTYTSIHWPSMLLCIFRVTMISSSQPEESYVMAYLVVVLSLS